MTREVLQNISALSIEYGVPLDIESAREAWEHFVDIRSTRPLPDSAVLGSVAFGANFINRTPVLVEVATLNESFGMMRHSRYDLGQLCGSIVLEARELPLDAEGIESEIPVTPLVGLFSIYTNGGIGIQYISHDEEKSEFLEFWQQMGFGELAISENGIATNVQEQLLSDDQVVKLQTFVGSAFTDLPS